jgi:hypothetical protein
MFTFYGIQLRQLTLNRFYKCYVGAAEIFGARIAGQWYDEETAETEFAMLFLGAPLLGPLFTPWFKKVVAKRAILEAEYDAMAPDFRQFMQKDPRNFQLMKKDIGQAEVKVKETSFALGNLPIAGVLHLQNREMKTTKLILPEGQDPEAILNALNAYG